LIAEDVLLPAGKQGSIKIWAQILAVTVHLVYRPLQSSAYYTLSVHGDGINWDQWWYQEMLPTTT
jgi:hypothetical protein